MSVLSNDALNVRQNWIIIEYQRKNFFVSFHLFALIPKMHKIALTVILNDPLFFNLGAVPFLFPLHPHPNPSGGVCFFL